MVLEELRGRRFDPLIAPGLGQSLALQLSQFLVESKTCCYPCELCNLEVTGKAEHFVVFMSVGCAAAVHTPCDNTDNTGAKKSLPISAESQDLFPFKELGLLLS